MAHDVWGAPMGDERMNAEKVHVPEERKSYLSTIYGKALDARAENPILGDRYADEAVRRIDFDFEKLAVRGDAAITLPFRAKHFDGWTREFLDAHPSSTVLHLGCGLDTRVFRIDPPATLHWYDVDLPDAIELRRQLYPERPGYEMIAASVADLQWLDSIPGDTPVLVVAEGLVQYLPVDDRGALFNRITKQFPSGEIIFDAYGRATLGVLNLVLRLQRTGLRLYGPIKDGHEIEEQVPRLRLVSAVSFLTLPEMVPLLIHSKAQGWLYRRMERWEWYRRSMQHFRYEF
jgi:O-methyltransferase involved in polyketide biosynthesis